MNNYENQKERVDAILNSNNNIAVDKETNKATTCKNLACSKCLFSAKNYDCYRGVIRWLVAEYKEPEVDWSSVPIDTPVLISGDGKEWYRRYFSGVDENGQPTVFIGGVTLWSSKDYDENERTWNVKHIKLAEVE